MFIEMEFLISIIIIAQDWEDCRQVLYWPQSGHRVTILEQHNILEGVPPHFKRRDFIW